ncbi:30S ribosomal protein S6 [Tessaracoccus antarcticus]|uniref:Small ribosomal subunit protein bS6 n=1 Tax=Tessaracoccus antarcticus TaxID=2479848 RepID=A0A3M0GF84_9ACTN|nr:30S ribosomal protein S6 [Tessaracoccus antarcticus]
MRKYEVMVIIDSDVDERQVPALVEKHLETITKGGGTVDNNDLWGRRRLAYDINKKSEGIYAVLRITAEPAVVQEMDRLMGIDEAIVRTKVLRVEEPKKSKDKDKDSKESKAVKSED